MPGMDDVCLGRIFEDCESEGLLWFDGEELQKVTPEERLSLNLDDPATKGCLLELVREAWGRRGLSLETWINPIAKEIRWGFDGLGKDGGYISGGSEAEALVKALEAAP